MKRKKNLSSLLVVRSTRTCNVSLIDPLEMNPSLPCTLISIRTNNSVRDLTHNHVFYLVLSLPK